MSRHTDLPATAEPAIQEAAAAGLDAAEDTYVWAHTRAVRADAPGLMYLANAPGADIYDVTLDGKLLGHLHHDAAEGILRGWTGHPGVECNAAEHLGPYLTSRQAAGAVHGLMR
ncbi:MAG: hypothetical protein QOE58_339 [Actinomycetota bacterium]|jgi:hypothetical protein|nr:hypothetical protein [Actinomycetota bacterium]